MSENRLLSRKFWLSVIGLIVSTAIFAAPSMAAMFGYSFAPLLTSSDFTNMTLGILALYTTGNVAERHIVSRNISKDKSTTNNSAYLTGDLVSKLNLGGTKK